MNPVTTRDTSQQALRDARTYQVSDERMRQFAQRTVAQRVQWVDWSGKGTTRWSRASSR